MLSIFSLFSFISTKTTKKSPKKNVKVVNGAFEFDGITEDGKNIHFVMNGKQNIIQLASRKGKISNGNFITEGEAVPENKKNRKSPKKTSKKTSKKNSKKNKDSKPDSKPEDNSIVETVKMIFESESTASAEDNKMLAIEYPMSVEETNAQIIAPEVEINTPEVEITTPEVAEEETTESDVTEDEVLQGLREAFEDGSLQEKIIEVCSTIRSAITQGLVRAYNVESKEEFYEIIVKFEKGVTILESILEKVGKGLSEYLDYISPEDLRVGNEEIAKLRSEVDGAIQTLLQMYAIKFQE